MQVSKSHRHRTPSDPFSDPSLHTPSFSSYGVPTLTRNSPLHQTTQRPPPTPPKVQAKASPAKRQFPSSPMSRDNVVEAVRDTVQLRTTDQNPRNRIGRSQTEMPSSRPPVAPASRRSLSQDSVLRAANSAEKSKSGGRTRASKKGSSHADVIDRLDFSGVGPMFHHDGPFDACAPSRNRHRTKAPMLAWSAVTDADKRALAAAQEINSSGRYESPYPSPDVYVPYEAPKKKNHDAIAEAWGMHEPEPFEDFSAGGGPTSRPSGEYTVSSRHGLAGNANTRRSKDERNPRDRYRDYIDDAQPPSSRRQQSDRARRAALPPPQPIFIEDGEVPAPISPGGDPPSPGAPKRNKSIIRRIRQMRDAPNVPMGPDDNAHLVGGDRDPSPTSSTENSAATHSTTAAHVTRPTHRPQNSFLGRFGRAANVSNVRRDDLSPTSASDEGGYVYVEDPLPPNKEKSLPATPAMKGGGSPPGENVPGYFDGTIGGAAGSPGLGRKTSLLKKVRGVVRGSK